MFRYLYGWYVFWVALGTQWRKKHGLGRRAWRSAIKIAMLCRYVVYGQHRPDPIEAAPRWIRGAMQEFLSSRRRAEMIQKNIIFYARIVGYCLERIRKARTDKHRQMWIDRKRKAVRKAWQNNDLYGGYDATPKES